MEYDDYKNFLLFNNFIGGNGPGQVPGQPVEKIGVDNIITYSFFTNQTDILNSGYYSSNSEEAVKFDDLKHQP